MNKTIYVRKAPKAFGSRVAAGLNRCATACSLYAFCVSSKGLGVEQRQCESEYQALLRCLKAPN